MGRWDVVEGECRAVMASMGPETVHCVVTSPPYWGLRDYGIPGVDWADGWNGCLGLEPTLEMYIAHLVEVFGWVRPMLRDDGTVWLNLGDSYAAVSKGSDHGWDKSGLTKCHGAPRSIQVAQRASLRRNAPHRNFDGLPHKNLIGIPWRVALALQADGWYLRSDVIWHKPNGMPESGASYGNQTPVLDETGEPITCPECGGSGCGKCWRGMKLKGAGVDRPTTAHEYVFELSKQGRYFYDAEGVRQDYAPDSIARVGRGRGESHKWSEGPGDQTIAGDWAAACTSAGRNLRTVWTIPPEPYPEAHFATFPTKLAARCILAGTPDRGCCAECGTPYVRIVQRRRYATRPGLDNLADQTGKAHRDTGRHVTETMTIGWKSGCACGSGEPVPAVVFDPFCGSGRTGVAARMLGRDFVGAEINPEYCEMARRQISNRERVPEIPDVAGQETLFEG